MDSNSVWQPLPFTQALDRALVLTRRHFRTVYLPVAVPVAIVGTLLAVAQMLVLQPFLNLGDTAAGAFPEFPIAGCALYAVLLLAYMAIGMLSQGVLFFAASDALEGRPLRPGVLWRETLRPRIALTLVLFSGILLGGAMLCLVPGIVAYALYTWTIPIMRSEGSTGLAALGRSSRLAQYRPEGRFAAAWKVAGAGIMGLVLHYLTSTLVQLPFQFVLVPLQMRQSLEPGSSLSGLFWLNVPMTTLSALVLIAVGMYVAFAQTVLYIDTRRRAEGGDLEAAVDGLYVLHGLPIEPREDRPA